MEGLDGSEKCGRLEMCKSQVWPPNAPVPPSLSGCSSTHHYSPKPGLFNQTTSQSNRRTWLSITKILTNRSSSVAVSLEGAVFGSRVASPTLMPRRLFFFFLWVLRYAGRGGLVQLRENEWVSG